MSKDYFANKAHIYEQNQNRVDNVGNVANAILDKITLDKSMHLVDFGSGTGLLLEKIAPFVATITAIDISPAMNTQLEEKRAKLGCSLTILPIDLEKQAIEGQFDGIISSMTMHHIQHIDAMFSKFFQLVKPGGFIAIADLDKEDGNFHSEDTGVYHAGFERDYIAGVAEQAGFTQATVVDASVIQKDQKDYPIFLLTAIR